MIEVHLTVIYLGVAVAFLGCWIALTNTWKINDLRHLINSRLDQLLMLTGQVARTKGVEEGRQMERDEAKG